MALLPRPTEPTEKAGRHVRNTIHSAWIGAELQAVLVPGAAAPEVIPAFVADFLDTCHEFRTLPEHVGYYASQHRLNRMQTESLWNWVVHLSEMKLLVSESGVIERLRAGPAGDDPPPLAALGVPTGGNTTRLLNCVESFVDNAQRHGRDVEFFVADNSADNSVTESSRHALADLARRTGARICFSGTAERERFARLLAEKSGVDPEVVRFALFDVHGCGFAAGANRNALLLHNVGRCFASVDDDVSCRIVEPPETEPGLGFYSERHAIQRRFFTSREAALESARFVDADFIGMHGEWLGQSLSACVRRTESCDFEGIRDGTLQRLTSGGAGVIATFTSFLPDPGIPTNCYHLHHDGENLRRLTQSEEFYRAAMVSRALHAWSRRVMIGDGELSPGIACGFDHRGLLPPCFPVFHAEDFSYGALLTRCRPDGFTAWLPRGVLHDPGPGKPLLRVEDIGGENCVVVFEFAQMLRHLVLRTPLPEGCPDRAERMTALGRHLRLLGSLSADAFRDIFHREILEHEGLKLGHLESRLFNETDAPEFWRADVERLIEQTREALTHDDFDIPWDLRPLGEPEQVRVLMQTLIRRFGELIECWPAIHAAALEMAGDGVRIGRAIV